MRRQSETTGQLNRDGTTFAEAKSGRKNLLDNGNFSAWSDGSSVSAINAMCANRWFIAGNVSDAPTAVKTTLGLGNAEIPGTATGITFTWTANAGLLGLRTRVEQLQATANRKVTLSFYARGVDKDELMHLYLQQNFGEGGSGAVVVPIVPVTVLQSDPLQRYSVTFDVPSIDGKTYGTGDAYLQCVLRVKDATGKLILSGVQLEIGEQATDLEIVSDAENQARCDRYYWTSYKSGTAPGTASRAGAIITRCHSDVAMLHRLTYQFPSMRAIPSVTVYSDLSGAVGKLRCAGVDQAANASQISENSATAALTSSYSVAVGGEISCHIVCDAELS